MGRDEVKWGEKGIRKTHHETIYVRLHVRYTTAINSCIAFIALAHANYIIITNLSHIRLVQFTLVYVCQNLCTDCFAFSLLSTLEYSV